MKKTLAAFAVLGALTLAPAAFAGETTPTDPVVAEAQFAAPTPQVADEAALVASHRAASGAEVDQAAGRKGTQDGWTIFAIGFLVVCAAIVAAA